MVSSRSVACAPSPCGPLLAVSRLGGRYPADYYGHSVAITQRALGDPMFTLLHALAWFRRPVRLLECPRWASLLRPGGLQRAPRHHAAEAGAGFRCISGGCRVSPSGDWGSGNQAFAMPRGSPDTPFLAPGHGHRFPGMLFSPLPFQAQVSHQIQRYSPPISARCAGSIAVRLMAHGGPRSPRPAPRRPSPWR
jgi:hypothetical protein